jgi:terminase small subunit / prophage DNA-packing protein
MTTSATRAPAVEPETRSPSPLLSRTELAALLGVNPVTITKWQGEGLPVAQRGGRGRESKYRMAEVWAWGLARERARASAGTNGGGADMSLPVERAKLSRIQTQLAQQKFRKAEGELLEAHEIGRTWSLIVLAIKAKLLALATAVADRVVSAVRGAADDAEARASVMAILTGEVRDILRELAGWKVEEPKGEESKAEAMAG